MTISTSTGVDAENSVKRVRGGALVIERRVATGRNDQRIGCRRLKKCLVKARPLSPTTAVMSVKGVLRARISPVARSWGLEVYGREALLPLGDRWGRRAHDLRGYRGDVFAGRIPAAHVIGDRLVARWHIERDDL